MTVLMRCGGIEMGHAVQHLIAPASMRLAAVGAMRGASRRLCGDPMSAAAQKHFAARRKTCLPKTFSCRAVSAARRQMIKVAPELGHIRDRQSRRR
jgi:hypothetical protein